MQLHHLSLRVHREGSIEDVFEKIDAAKRGDFLPVVPVIRQVREYLHGPDLWAYEGHNLLVIAPGDEPGDSLLQLHRTHEFYKVIYYHRFRNSWDAMEIIHAPNAVPTAIVIAYVLQIVAPELGFKYVNNNPPATVKRKGAWIRCPHCESGSKSRMLRRGMERSTCCAGRELLNLSYPMLPASVE